MWTHRRSGQTNQRGSQDHRDPYERDRTRVIHCPAFRRLQRKTQILGTDEGDFHRTRLTHSLEVDSIGRSIVRNLMTNQEHQLLLSSLLPNDDLISVICLLHDIGHPPFGHGGEVALNYMMRNYGGFEGNGQTLRLLTKVENSYGGFGLDLTRRALLGILKYPVKRANVAAPKQPPIHESIHKTIKINDWLPPKAYFDCEQPEVDWLLSPLSDNDRELFQSLSVKPNGTQAGKAAYHNFDCSIMDTADDIAYGVHDLEDAIHLRLINRSHLDTPEFRQLISETSLSMHQERLLNSLFSPEICLRKQAIGEMVNYFITSTQIIVTNEKFENSLLKHNIALIPEAHALLNYLMQCIYNNVIDSQEARTFEYGGQTVVLRLFDAISSNPASLLDNKNRVLFSQAPDEVAAYRVVCDYLANMTDEYAYRMHERLFGFNTRTIFERL
ncbi:TPA: deoxyguanosinetriphosphate triphosphohydrolase family protein [Legionella pneumophila]|uniref:Deoxyguanosinetriphosphate triphosphohydrolase-like protein n=1 Tax=Legionella pneumophila TaxID=446 RepID=A0AAN5R3J8_LEGPN|nr:anti-phage deoxyguanosine triphosphatase [Legionella pneumophila]MDW8877826.1 anti-phage deoxyguanosine triphosphatase [Legionella pneumophila subsp. fraseri]MDW8960865.1 anti-phage deoxyguanosine triphosphatase [Legionella pneumophila subsp. fraseri]MDW9035111.1 anti-phage deoxyguanosine triphosphatase [Legionella pneumophila subsp. fraseri]MDW9038173.1 anti-phage deoxyguanosine triphosphatase [Legionella pneumophila subsp. fraseri]MDW9041233.1 anti-phage deoxyguanosine triphosphatase [Leg